MADLYIKGSTQEKWHATLYYNKTIANNKLTINITKVKIVTDSDFTITSKKWSAANATFTITVYNATTSTTLETWTVPSQSWRIGANDNKIINFSKTKTINATYDDQSIQLTISVVYHSKTSTNSKNISLPAKPHATITFEQGTSTGTPPRAITTEGNWQIQDITMPRNSTTQLNALTKEVTSYQFEGWSILNNVINGNVNYKTGVSYSLPSTNLTLYPGYLQLITTYHSAILSFNGNSDNAVANLPSSLRDDTSIVINNNITFTIPNIRPTTSGKAFMYWVDSNGTKYNPGQQITIKSGVNTILYAHWIDNNATLILDVTTTGGSLGSLVRNNTIQYNTQYTIPSAVPTKTGYMFSGWSKEPNGEVIWNSSSIFKYANSEYNTINEEVIPLGYTIYAKWEESYKTLTYNANGTTEAPAYLNEVPATERMYYSKEYYITNKIPIRIGYQFLGWSTNSGATTASYYENSLYKVANTDSGNITLYAIWKSNLSTDAEIIYNANGGSLNGITSPQPMTWANAAYINTRIPIKQGYTFVEWVDASGTPWDPGEQYKQTEEPAIRLSLTAVWELNGNIFIGVNGKAKKISNIYIGDQNGVAKPVTAIYVGVNGKAQKIL